MPDFFVSSPEVTQFKLKDENGNLLGTVDAIDVIEMVREAREDARESGDIKNWFTYFSKSFLDTTGVKMSKTQALILIGESEKSFLLLKKSGSENLKQQEQLEETIPSQNETTESTRPRK